MLFTNLLLTGTVLYAGVETYKKRKQKKENPWTFYAEKMAKKDKRENSIRWKAKRRSKKNNFVASLKSPAHDSSLSPIISRQAKVAFSKAITSIPATSQTRHEQLSDISSTLSGPQKSEAEQKAERDLMISLGSMGLAGTGLLWGSFTLGLLSVPGVLYTALPIYKRTWTLLKAGNVSVDTLSALSIAFCLGGGYFFVGSLASLSYRLSRILYIKVKDDSKKNMIDVFRMQPQSVWVVENEIEVEIPLEFLKSGDILIVQAGELIPADGVITAGIASIDQHILTGESQPAEKESGDQVFASTVVLSGKIRIQVEHAGAETIVAKIGKILNNTAEFKSATELQAEKMADSTVWPTLMISTVSLPFLGPYGAAAIVNAHFKHRLAVLAPIGIFNYLNLMSQYGILIKDGRTLDLLNQVDTIVFDKTGTLTQEQPHLEQIHACAEYSADEILLYAAAAEEKQSHPIARAILQEAEARGLTLPRIAESEYKVGYGLTVTIENKLIRVGSRRFIEMVGITIPAAIKETQANCHRLGHALVMVALDNQLIGALELEPTIRPEAQRIIRQLKQRPNIKEMYIISGDHETPTRNLAHRLGIDHYFAETLPKDKADLIEQLQTEGKFVCYIGDGINDSIALKKSQVSISLRGASTIATDTAQIILMDESLNQLVRLFELAQEFDANTKVSFMTLLTSTMIGIGGAIFLHFGLLHTILLSHAALLAGIVNTTRPFVKHQRAIQKSEQAELAITQGKDNDGPHP
jgi:Cu2+-exporting ATPase